MELCFINGQIKGQETSLVQNTASKQHFTACFLTYFPFRLLCKAQMLIMMLNANIQTTTNTTQLQAQVEKCHEDILTIALTHKCETDSYHLISFLKTQQTK